MVVRFEDLMRVASSHAKKVPRVPNADPQYFGVESMITYISR